MKKRLAISTFVAAAMLAGLAPHPVQAGLLDKVKKKVREATEEAKAELEQEVKGVLDQAESVVEAQIEQRIDEALEPAAEVQRRIDETTGAVAGATNLPGPSVDAALGQAAAGLRGALQIPETAAPAPSGDDAVGSILDGLRSAAQGTATTQAAPSFAASEVGGFFRPPPGVSTRDQMEALIRARPAPDAGRDPVLLMRRGLQDAYYYYWMSWFTLKEQYGPALQQLRAQRQVYQEIGATREAEALGQQIAAVEAGLREFVSAPSWESLGDGGPLFGVKLGSPALPLDSIGSTILPAIQGSLGLLAQAVQHAPSAEARQRAVDLARDLTAIRSNLEAGNHAAAQQIMDRRWAWVMQP